MPPGPDGLASVLLPHVALTVSKVKDPATKSLGDQPGHRPGDGLAPPYHVVVTVVDDGLVDHLIAL